MEFFVYESIVDTNALWAILNQKGAKKNIGHLMICQAGECNFLVQNDPTVKCVGSMKQKVL